MQRFSGRNPVEREISGIRLAVKTGVLTLQSQQSEQREAEEELEIAYQGEEIEDWLQRNYLRDALAAIDVGQVELGLTDANSSCLVSRQLDAVRRSTSSCRCWLTEPRSMC